MWLLFSFRNRLSALQVMKPNDNGDMEAYMDLFAAVVVEHLQPDDFAAKSANPQCTESALWPLVFDHGLKLDTTVREMTKAANKRIAAATEETSDPMASTSSANDAADALSQRLNVNLHDATRKRDIARPPRATGAFADDSWSSGARKGKAKASAPARAHTPQNGLAKAAETQPVAAAAALSDASPAAAAPAGPAPAVKVGGKRGKAGKRKGKASSKASETPAAAPSPQPESQEGSTAPTPQWWMPNAM